MELNNLKDIKDNIEGIVLSKRETSKKLLNEIIDSFPLQIKTLIEQNFEHKRIPKEYLFSSILFAFSNAGGLAYSLTSMNYTNYPNLFLVIIGSRGDTKSAPMDIATNPLNYYDNERYNEYRVACDQENDPNNKPIRKRLLIQNASIESMKYEHSKNPYSIGIYYDEFMYVFDKMSNSKSPDGADLRSFLLSCFNNGFIDISRRTTDNFRMEQTFVTLLGSVQTQFTSKLFANGNLESGLIDRILFTPKLTSNPKLSKVKINKSVLDSYNILINNLLSSRNETENFSEVKSIELKLQQEAEQKIYDYTQKLIDLQEKSDEIIKAYLAKLMIYVHKLTLLVHLINNSQNSNFESSIEPKSVDIAIKICGFYFNNFQIILEENCKSEEKKINVDDMIKMAMKNNGQQKDVVAITGLNKSTISRRWGDILSNQQLATSTKNIETSNENNP
ncbi:DUF3987 domain-containing protein [Flavobacterium sp. LS2P90]|uniref:DUF3987 domain-containing protein n=1 Tax=Flavobacterium xylosi TaxID=3230415 RepID=A0ABW6HSP7_9FLAO